MYTSDIILLIILLGYTIFGAWRGLIATVCNLVFSIAAWIGAAIFAGVLSDTFPWLAVFIVVFVLINLLSHVVIKVLDLAAKLPLIRTANRLLGGLLGFVHGAVVLVVICSIAASLGIIHLQDLPKDSLLAVFAGFQSMPV